MTRPEEKETRVDETRRNLLKAAAVAGGASLISFVAVDKDKLKAVLSPVSLEDIVGEAEAAEAPSELERRAAQKTKEMKKICFAEAQKLCQAKGENSPECKEAKRRCEMIKVKATPPKPGVRYAMALDINKCIGCRRCAYACVMENNTDREMAMEWIKVVSVPREELEILNTDWQYRDAPKKDMVYIPMACMHCEDPPCVMVCPVVATFKEPDGIVVVDYDRCIGCRYCLTACPYGARRFNWRKPKVPVNEINPNMHILGNVLRPAHVMEKCTWCIQRSRDGGIPACVEVCPVGARVFGDLNDPNSPIRQVMEEYGAFVLKPAAGTKPRFFYYFGPARTPPRNEKGESTE